MTEQELSTREEQLNEQVARFRELVEGAAERVATSPNAAQPHYQQLANDIDAVFKATEGMLTSSRDSQTVAPDGTPTGAVPVPAQQNTAGADATANHAISNTDNAPDIA